MALLAELEPVKWQDAMKKKEWKNAMQEEMLAIEKNHTWNLVEFPSSKKPIDLKWVYKLKLKPDGSIAKYKARHVARGFLQKEGVDYSEVYAPVARLETMRLVVALAAFNGWSLYQLDVKSAFLNGELEEEVYVLQPPGFELKGEEHKVYKLNKALYGLKQAPRAWNRKIDNFLQKQSFVKCSVEFGVYFKRKDRGEVIVICLYVDDLLVTGSDQSKIEEFKKILMSEFEMSNLGILGYFLGMEFVHVAGGILLHQRKYISDVLRRFKMEDCNVATTPCESNVRLTKAETEKAVDPTLFKQIVGSLRFVCKSRPDVMFSVGLVSRFMSDPRVSHMVAAKRILRYLKGTQQLALLFPRKSIDSTSEIEAFSDSDWCGDKVERKSTSGYWFRFLGAPISWSSKKQNVVALSSCEAEYIAACQAACQALWLDSLLNELEIAHQKPVKLKVDNKSSISLAKNPVLHGRSKHIETKYHFIRDQVSKGKLEMSYCNTAENVADIFTKSLNVDRFKEMRKWLNLVCLDA